GRWDAPSRRRRRAARGWEAGREPGLGRYVPRHAAEPDTLAALVPIPDLRPMGDLLRRRALRHDAPDDDRLSAGTDLGNQAQRTHDPDLRRGPARGPIPESGVPATVGVDRWIHDPVLHAAGRLRAPHPTI